MEYQKINVLYNTPNQPSKFKTQNWVEINDGTLGMYKNNSQFKFKTTISKSGLCDYDGAHQFVKETISHKHQNSSNP